VVITALTNYALPLIRYENGDMAEPGPPCDCGRGLPVLARVAGRVRNLAVLPNGDRVTPTLATEDVLNRLPIRQFQLIQSSRETITARLAVERPLGPAEEAEIAAFFNRGFGYPFAFVFDYVDEIPRLPNGKFEVFRCEVEA
jgi:phenylacetate-CoA ligase